MAILIKTARQDFSAGQIIVPFRRSSWNTLETGVAGFLWFSETQGGAGLAGRGVVESFGQQADLIEISLTNFHSVGQPLGNGEIGPFRNSSDQRPESTLAKKVYRYSHNRVVHLTDDECTFLSGHLA